MVYLQAWDLKVIQIVAPCAAHGRSACQMHAVQWGTYLSCSWHDIVLDPTTRCSCSHLFGVSLIDILQQMLEQGR